MAPHNCSHGQVGKSLPVLVLTTILKRRTSSCRSSAENSVSLEIFFSAFNLSISTSNGLCSPFPAATPITTSPYICTKRRYESHANLALPDFSATILTASSFIPKFNTVSIIPGMDTLAPERTETKRGKASPFDPNLAFINFSVAAMPALTSFSISFTTASFPS